MIALGARAALAADKSDKVVFPQGTEQPLAALTDIDVVEHVGDRVPSGLAFRDTAGHQVAFDDSLHQGRPLVVTLGYHRCPMLCGLVLDGLAKALKGWRSHAGPRLHRGVDQHRPRRGREAGR